MSTRFVLLGLCQVLTGCWTRVATAVLATLSFGAWAQAPAPLELGVLPNVSARVLVTQYEPMQSFLSQRLGRSVAVSTAPDWREFYLRVRKGDYDVVVAAANVARLMERDLGYRPLLAYEPRIPAILIAAKGADSTLNPLISGKTVAFSNPASLVAFEGQGWLSQRGLEAGRNYQTLAVRRDDSVGSAILRGEAAAGILSMGEFRAHPEAVRDQLTVVATMTEVPSFIVATRKDLASAQVDAIRTALLAFSQGSEEGRQFFQRSGFRAISPIADKDLAGLDAFVDRTRKALE